MKQYEITPNDADQRLDKFLKKLFWNATLSFLYKCNRKGNIKIFKDWKKTKQSNEYKLQVWDLVQIFLSDGEIEKISQVENEVALSSRQNEGIRSFQKQNIVFEDEYLLVLNKNPWQNVHPGDHASTEVSLIEQVHDYFWKSLNSLTFKPSLIHRIDRDTSWVIMIAKNKTALTRLSDDFKSHTKIQKTYFCLVLWKLSRSSGTVRKKLKRIENALKENKVQVSEGWLEAITHYTLIDEYKIDIPNGEQIISSLEVTIETWRMHQIRVHLAALWNPILWDKTYWDKKLNSYFAKNFPLTRQMLHAWKIEFNNPISKKKMSLEAKLKKDMIEFIQNIKK